MRYQISRRNPPRGYDTPDPEITKIVQTLVNEPGVWFFIENFDEDLAEAIEELINLDFDIGFEMYTENNQDAWVRYLVIPQEKAEPVSDD